MDYLRFLSCSNVQYFHWEEQRLGVTFDLTALNSLHDVVFTLSCLKTLYIYVPQGLGIHSLIHFVFCGASEQGVWRDIRSVEVEIQYNNFLEASHLFDRTVGR
jgi:hypothetical protein